MLDAFLAEHEPAKDDRKDDCAAAPDANPRT
jgi:hypothetical protein